MEALGTAPDARAPGRRPGASKSGRDLGLIVECPYELTEGRLRQRFGIELGRPARGGGHGQFSFAHIP